MTSLTKFGQQQIDNLLKLEKIDKNTIELKTKADAIFKTKIDRNENQDILRQIQDLEKVDEAAALYCSEQRINNLKVYKLDYQIMTDKLQKATTITHESREIAAANISIFTRPSSTRTSKSTMENNISSLQH